MQDRITAKLMTTSRRSILALGTAVPAKAQTRPRREMWKPKVGGLDNYSPANVAILKNEGFTSIGLWGNG